MEHQHDEPQRPDTIGDEVKRLVLRSLQGNIELLRQASQVSHNLSTSSGAGPRTVGDWVSRLIRLNVDYYTLLTDHSQAFVKEALNLAERSLTSAPARRTPQPPSPATHLQAVGRAGETARTVFIVANEFSAPAALSFTIDDFRSSDGQTVPANEVVFNPTTPTLSPGTEQVVEVSIPIGPQFQVGREYTTRVRVEGYRARELNLILRVEAAADDAHTPAQGAVASPSEELALTALGLSTRVANILEGAGVTTAAELKARFEKGEDNLRAIPGIGPKAIQEIRETLTEVAESGDATGNKAADAPRQGNHPVGS